jgi:hypothetical protein
MMPSHGAGFNLSGFVSLQVAFCVECVPFPKSVILACFYPSISLGTVHSGDIRTNPGRETRAGDDTGYSVEDSTKLGVRFRRKPTRASGEILVGTFGGKS